MYFISSRNYLRNSFLVIALLLTAHFAFAQDSASADTIKAAAANVPPVAPLDEQWEVLSVTSCDPLHSNTSGLGDDIVVKIKNADSFFGEVRKDNAKVVLFINNIPVRDAAYEHTADGLRFFLPNEGDVIELWEYLMKSRGKTEFFEKEVAVSVGIESQDTIVKSFDPIPTRVDGKPGRSYTLVLVYKTWFVICILIMLTIVILFITMSKRTDMLRDTGPQPVTGRKPYSLARVQMAVWFLVIICAWLLLYVCLHHFNLLNEKILILLGITAGTGVGGLALDTNKAQSPPATSEGFLRDLISDHSNISLFRFQNMAWTLVLVIVFIRSVFVYLKMPEFDMTLLTLMGISSGTYIGAKVTEKRVAEDAEKAAATEEQLPN